MLIANVLRGKGEVVHTLSPDATLEQAAAELGAHKVGALVVLDETGGLIGVLSERDIVRAIGERGGACLSEAVSAVMTRKVVTAHLGESVEECLERMTDRRFRHLPIVDEGRLVGIVSIGDLVKHRIEKAEAHAAAMEAYIAAQ